MSGGHLDYSYGYVEHAARQLEESVIRRRGTEHERENDDLRARFAKHLFLVADALRDCEWVLSDDYGDEQDVEAILACINPQNNTP